MDYFAKFYNHLPLVSARPFATSVMFEPRSKYNLSNRWYLMSEGPEVKIIADKISSLLKGKEIEDIMFKNLDIHIKNKIIGFKL